jgi:hypothetical protein
MDVVVGRDVLLDRLATATIALLELHTERPVSNQTQQIKTKAFGIVAVHAQRQRRVTVGRDNHNNQVGSRRQCSTHVHNGILDHITVRGVDSRRSLLGRAGRLLGRHD